MDRIQFMETFLEQQEVLIKEVQGLRKDVARFEQDLLKRLTDLEIFAVDAEQLEVDHIDYKERCGDDYQKSPSYQGDH